MSLYKKFHNYFRRSYKKNPESLFCKTVIRISRFIQPYKIFFQTCLIPYKKYTYRQAFKKVLKTPPFSCNPEADCEIHTLTSHYHAFMYMAAIKSFLRFYQDVAVVVHDDGGLTRSDKMLLERHIRGIRIIERKFADEKISQLLEHYPYSRMARNKKVNSLQLFDFFVFSERDKLINLDSDVLFLAKPIEIIDWICTNNNEMMSLYEEEPLHQKQFLSDIDCGFPSHVCIGLGCLYKDIFDLALIENVLNRTALDWPVTWWTGQNIFPVLFQRKTGSYATIFLNKDKYQGFYYPVEDGVIFRHYLSSTPFSRYEEHIADAGQVIREIQMDSKMSSNGSK